MKIQSRANKLICLLLSLMMLVSVFTVLPFSADAAKSPKYKSSGDFSYAILRDGTAEITSYTGNAKSLEIPSSFDGHKVTSIGMMAFSTSEKLKSVTIPDSVKTIEDSAFAFNIKLTSVTIGKGVKNIDDWAFYDCLKLKKFEVAPKNKAFSSIKGNLYNKKKTKLIKYAAGKKAKSFKIPSTVTNIGHMAFHSCYNLKNVTLPKKLTKISDAAFRWCDIKSVTIPNKVKKIGACAFQGCTHIKSLTIPGSVESIGFCAFGDCSGVKNLVIEDGVKSISNEAFAGCEKLKSVTIPDSVTYIGENAFTYCPNMESLTISNGVKTIEYGAFSSCSGLKNLTIPDSVERINNWAFVGCDSLTSVTIPNSVKYIGIRAFSDCNNLTDVTIPGSVAHIDEEAFFACSKITNVTIPYTVTKIGKRAFGYYDYYDEDNWETIYKKYKDFTITGYSESAAEDYAIKNKFDFVSTGVSTITYITIENAPKKIYVTDTVKINATVTHGNGETTYKSSDDKVATVNESGEISALNKGAATITVTNNGVSESFLVAVKNPTLNYKRNFLSKGRSFKLKITGGVGTPKFSSDNKKVATVDSNGKVTAKKNGNATITVKTNGMKLKCKIEVE